MARQVAVALFVLAFVALIGLQISCTDAVETTTAPAASSNSSEAPDSTTGAMGKASAPSGGDVEAAPVGGPIPPGAPAPSPGNSVSGWLHVSAVAGTIAAGMACYFF
ncbi:hypothetical protein SAY86_020435 [Trapa natans]|uniref:Uncharacterized protein n=1 Tax=Trapa natans TaxID=22666 RepID=A0AAN7LMN2_TRANT|nr:hypothetical protein SAY86_020435 [Trapa natans]